MNSPSDFSNPFKEANATFKPTWLRLYLFRCCPNLNKHTNIYIVYYNWTNRLGKVMLHTCDISMTSDWFTN